MGLPFFPPLCHPVAPVTASLALPDLGVLALDELVFVTRAICRAVDLPLLVDGDTGYGEALNVMRLVRELEDAGAAAVQIEDQILPKKCGHLSDKRLATPEDMARKVAAAARAARRLRIIARTDAVASEGLPAAIARAHLYREAGAHAIFPDALPNAPLSGGGTVTALFSEAGIADFHGAARHLLGLPYGRTSDRSKPALVLTEGRGTCSSKHALLAELAHELGLDVRLTLGIF